MLSARDEMQIFQTVTVRLMQKKYGPPESFTDEEKAFYISTEKQILEDEKAGKKVVYDFPNDYD